MDFVILAAGESRRLMPLTTNIPKCMVRINGKSIIHHILDVINEIDSNARIIIVSGYKSDVLYKHCRGYIKNKLYTGKIMFDHLPNSNFIKLDRNF